MATAVERWRGTGGLQEQQRFAVGEAISYMRSAYMAGRWALPPDEVEKNLRVLLKEVDPWLLQDLIGQMGWDVISGLGYDTDTSAERESAIQDARRLYKYSPLAQWCVDLWTGWGLGDRITVTPNDAKADKWWQEFWSAERNAAILGDDHLDEISDFLLVTGERFLTYFCSEQDGLVTIRSTQPTEITTILTNPNDGAEPWFYRREWQEAGQTMPSVLYYPDWQLYLDEDAQKADEAWGQLKDKITEQEPKRADELASDESNGTIAVMQFVCHNRKDERILRGWPISLPAAPWVRSHQTYMQNRLTSSTAVASTIRRYKVSGGSRAVDAMQARLQSGLGRYQYRDTNPTPPGGSSDVVNKATDVSELPMKTGATDAKADNDMFTWMALLGYRILPTSAGLDTARWATAVEMDKAQSMVFQSYQNFWSAQWKRAVKIVLGLAEKHGRQTFKDKEAEVSIDAFSLSDFPAVASSIGELTQKALVPLVGDGTIPPLAAKMIAQRLWRLSLQALGTQDADVTSDEAFGITEEGEEPATEPTGEEPETTIEQIAAMVRENVKAGSVSKEDAFLLELAEMIAEENA